MVDIVGADSQLSAHPQGLLFLGHDCGRVPWELQGSSRLGRVYEGREGMLSLQDQWKGWTPWTWVQHTRLRGQFKWSAEGGATRH